MPRGPKDRDIVSTRKTIAGDAITVERTPRWPVWITAWDGEDEVGLGLSVKDAMWFMAALQVAIDGPLADAPQKPSSPPRLELLQGGPEADGSSPKPRRGPLGIIGRPRPVQPTEGA